MDPNSVINVPLTPEQVVTNIVSLYFYVVAIATIIIRLLPVFKDKSAWLPIIKFVAKFIALNTNAPTERPK